MEVHFKGKLGFTETLCFDEPVELQNCFKQQGSDALCKCGSKVKYREFSMYYHLATDRHKRWMGLKDKGIDPTSKSEKRILYECRKYPQEIASEVALKKIEAKNASKDT